MRPRSWARCRCPVILLDVANRFRHVNNAAEQFPRYLRGGPRAASGWRICCRTTIRCSGLIEQVARVPEATISDHDLNLDSPRLHKRGITVQGVAIAEEPGAVLLVMQDASGPRARWIGNWRFVAPPAAVSGMAAILAHEVKNPLSGIRGAAQLLERQRRPGGPRTGRTDPR